MSRAFLSVLVLLLSVSFSISEELTDPMKVKLKGDVFENEDLSAIGKINGLLIIASDEGGKAQILKPAGDDYEVIRTIDLNHNSNAEIDVEGIATQGQTVYLLGSHSYKRKKLKKADEKTIEKNLETFGTIKPPVGGKDNRDQLIRLTLDQQGKPTAKKITSLRDALEKHEILKPFLKIPSKENGVDLEGIAVRGSTLYVGFRGPVLRHSYVPVMTCDFDNPKQSSKLVFVDLGGRGIRDLARVDDGFLILAGPVGEGPGSYQIYFWDGNDYFPGKRDGERGKLKKLARVPSKDGAKPEGLLVLSETDNSWKLLIVNDSVKDGGAVRYQLSKP